MGEFQQFQGGMQDLGGRRGLLCCADSWRRFGVSSVFGQAKKTLLLSAQGNINVTVNTSVNLGSIRNLPRMNPEILLLGWDPTVGKAMGEEESIGGKKTQQNKNP